MSDDDILNEIRKIRRLLEGQPGEPIPLPQRPIPPGTTHVTFNFFFGNQTHNRAEHLQIGAQGDNAQAEGNAFEQQKPQQQVVPADLLERLERIIADRAPSKNEDD